MVMNKAICTYNNEICFCESIETSSYDKTYLRLLM